MRKLPIKKLTELFVKRQEIHTVLVYGSVAKARVRQSSDIDFAILLSEKPKDGFVYASKLGAVLEDQCGRETDILILNSASPHIAFRAIKEGKMIYQKKNRSLWNAFVVKTISMNEDMEILYRKVSRG